MRIGELFSGYGGLGMGVQTVLGGDVVWHSDIDKGACKILAHRYPDVPNHGDITTVDWSQVEPVDVLTGGSPCQDLSHAGRRAGMSEGTRSNLWIAMREAIAALRPPLVIWENVRGAYSAGADSELETRPGLLGSVRRRDGEPVLRALGRVLGDLSDLGYDAQWHGLRAADVGAPHGRFRVFLVATAAYADGRVDLRGCARADQRAVPHGDAGGPAAALLPTPTGSDTNGTKGGPNQRGSSGDLMLPSAVAALLPTPSCQDGGHSPLNQAQRNQPMLAHAIGSLLPTPAVNDMGEGKTPDTWDEWTAKMQAAHGNGNGHGKSLSIEAQRLLPTPVVGDATGGNTMNNGSPGGTLNADAKALHGSQWGDYAAAIARWETVLGRPAPEPIMTSAKGNPQLSPVFVEWMMGLHAGWVTDVPGITRNEALRALGNGVVSQQCAAALRLMLGQAVAA